MSGRYGPGTPNSAAEEAMQTTLGNRIDTAAPADASGSITVLAALKRVLLNGAGIIANLPASLGQKTTTASFPVTIASDQTEVATKAADGSNVTAGAKADAAYTGTGAASLVAILKGLYAAAVAALPTGSNIIGRVLPREDATQADAVTGNITASAQTITLATAAAYTGAVVSWSGTFAGISLAFFATYSGVDLPVSAVPVAGGAPVTTLSGLSAAGAYEIYAPGATAIKATSTAWTSGTMAVKITPVANMSDQAPAISGGTLNTVSTVTTVSTVSNVAAIAAGANLIADVSHQPRATAGGIASVARMLSAAATTNGTNVKASAGRVYRMRGYNAKASVVYLKLYNKATTPAPGTDTPTETIALAPSAVFDIDFGVFGRYYATGIGFGLTTGSADADTGALTAADVVGLNIWYA